MTEELGDQEKAAAEASAELTKLRADLTEANDRINKYDGERKDASEQGNQITALTEQLTALQEQIKADEDEDTKDEAVTQAELKTYKEGEAERFNAHTKSIADKQSADSAEYQTELGKASLSIKDEDLFNAICKEHDELVASNSMPERTGNIKTDALLAWKEAENSHYRKQIVAGTKTNPFQDITKVETKPLVPGTENLGTKTTETQKTTMPDLPDDAKEFLALMGDSNNADKVNAALAQ